MRRFFAFTFGLLLMLCLSIPPAQAQTPTATPTPTFTPTPTPTLGAPDCDVYVLFEFIGILSAGLDPVAQQLFEETVTRMGYSTANQPDHNIGFRWNLVHNKVIADGRWYYRPDYPGLVEPFQRRFGFDEALMRQLITMRVFGRGGCVKQDSRLEALEYISDNKSEWAYRR